MHQSTEFGRFQVQTLVFRSILRYMNFRVVENPYNQVMSPQLACQSVLFSRFHNSVTSCLKVEEESFSKGLCHQRKESKEVVLSN